MSCNNATDPADRANQALRECRAELAELKTTVVANQQAADREYKRRVQAESERDTARAELKALTAPLQEGESWTRLTYDEGYRDGVASLQAKVARAVALWDASLKARGAQYQIAESEFYEALEALR